LKYLEKKRLELFTEYMHAFNTKIDFTQKIIKEASDLNTLDNTKIIETINKNLENLTKQKDQEFEEMGHLNNTIVGLEHHMSLDSNLNLTNTFKSNKSNDFYIKKKVNYTHSTHSNNMFNLGKI
jgi:uncharacterized protein YlaN (UPF0358 family)